MTTRKAEIKRETLETKINLTLDLDGSGQGNISTGIGFLDHLYSALTKHSGINLDLAATGDLHIDDHHTAEDTAIVLGKAFDQALGDRKGIVRFGYAYAPLDEALARAVIDLSGRPYSVCNLDLVGTKLGELSTENVSHVVESFAFNARAAIHVDVIRGSNDHHKAEAAFKALALALKQAIKSTGSDAIPSTKGAL